MHPKIKKYTAIILLSGIISSFLFFSGAKIASAADGGAGWAHQIAWMTKEFGLDTVARLFARRLLKGYLDKIVQQVNQSGRTGRQPSFALNWRNFLTDAEHRGEDVFRAILADTELCPYFGGKVRTTYGARQQQITQNTRVNNLDPYTKRARCTMPRGWTPEDLSRDFLQGGGWQALAKLAEPQNNSFGSVLIAAGELGAQRAIDAKADSGEISAGRGFTGTRASCHGFGSGGICLDQGLAPGQTGPTRKTCRGGGPKNNQPCEDNAGCAVENKEAKCTFLGEVLTPGSLLGDSASDYIDKNIGFLITSDELSEVVMSLIGAMVNKMTNFRDIERTRSDGNEKETQKGEDETESIDSKYKRCARQCQANGTDDYTQYRACMETCSPESVTNPTLGCAPDLPGVPRTCDTNLGEDIVTCPRDCTPVPPCTPTCNVADDRLSPGEALNAGGVINSANGLFTLTLQASDGNLVIYDNRTTPGTVVYSGAAASPAFRPGTQLIMDPNGGLKMYNTLPPPDFVSNFNTNTPGAYLLLQGDGNAVFFNSSNQMLFPLNTF